MPKEHTRSSTYHVLLPVQYEGILVQDTYEAHAEAWRRVAQEFDLPRPLGHTFR